MNFFFDPFLFFEIDVILARWGVGSLVPHWMSGSYALKKKIGAFGAVLLVMQARSKKKYTSRFFRACGATCYLMYIYNVENVREGNLAAHPLPSVA